MSTYRSDNGESNTEPSGEAVARRRPDQTLAERIGTMAVARQAETRGKVGQRFEDLVKEVIGGDQAAALLRYDVGSELFRTGVVKILGNEDHNVAVVSNNATTGDMLFIEPVGGPRPDNRRNVYVELRDLGDRPDKVLRTTMHPVTGKLDVQDRDGMIGPAEMTGLEEIVHNTQWGEVQQREASTAETASDVYRLGRPFRPEIQ